MVRIDVYGPFAAKDDEGSVGFGARSAGGVVAYLALARSRRASRDALAAAIWPDQDGPVARTNLRKAVQRIRQALPEGALGADGDDLFLASAKVETDVEIADRLHRTFLLAARQPEGTAALAQEWEIRRHTLLEGWDDDWIAPHRARATHVANDLGVDLARAHESTGDAEAALAVWRELLERIPHHAQGLQNALRLELQLRGRVQAAELAREARDHFRDELGIEMPRELLRTVRDFRAGALEPVPPPEFLRKRSELNLLARLFESNLGSNQNEALALLARECTFDKAGAHPRAMLSLLTLALERTEGHSPDRIQVAENAVAVASLASEYEVAHQWVDVLVAATEPSGARHARALGMKGFLYFERREWSLARAHLHRARAALGESAAPEDALRIENQVASLDWHLLEGESADAVFRSTLAALRGRSDPIAIVMLTTTHGNLCLSAAMGGRFDEAVENGRAALRHAEGRSAYEWVIPAPLGFALFACGERREGVRLMERALLGTLREGMARFNQIALDFAIVALARGGRARSARCLRAAAEIGRTALGHGWSPAETAFLRSVPELAEGAAEPNNPLLGQSAATLAEWTCEELGRLAAEGSTPTA